MPSPCFTDATGKAHTFQSSPLSGRDWDCHLLALSSLGGRFDLLGLHRRNPERYPHILESTATGTQRARYSLAFAFPGAQLSLEPDGHLTGGDNPEEGDFFTAFNHWWWRDHRAPTSQSVPRPPFTGGWVLFLAYEAAGLIEPTLSLPAAAGAFPLAWAVRVPAAVIIDHQQESLLLVSEKARPDLMEAMATDVACAHQNDARSSRNDGSKGSTGLTQTCLKETLMEDDPALYLAAAQRCIDYINAGDVFQVNLSRSWRGTLTPDWSHADLYDRLRQRNPAPFAGLMTRGEAAIISSSPERLIQVSNGMAQTRPIAGTRPRGPSRLLDVSLSQELLAHPKERAEHLMLVDLERNDLSRFCLPGSVTVNEMMVIESYAHVHHIVSNVQGRLNGPVAPGDIIKAVFPGGTITGCPKVRCMEILAEQEGTGRGAYTGAMGYVNRDGSLDLNILIRTMTRQGDTIGFRAGGGLVADSVPERELAETRAKARGMVRALMPAPDDLVPNGGAIMTTP